MKKTTSENRDLEALACRRKTTIGGQALIEGLMMIGPEKKAMAVRRPDGTIAIEEMPMTRFTGAANWPFVRGCIRLFRQLVSGTKALLRSAELAEEPEQNTDEASDDQDLSDKQAQKPSLKVRIGRAVDRFFSRHSELVLYGSAAFGILFSVALFILLPNLLISFIRQWTGLGNIASNLAEGLIRISLFVSYLALANRLQEMRRVWMYHGAEHKTIACYEAQQPMTVENVRRYSRFHPRCGTAFLFLVILISIIIFSLIGWWGRWINLLIRFALVPLVAGIAYEIIRLAGRYDNRITRLISKPGLWLQRLTTAEPDDTMLEVAIAALEAVRPMRANSDRW
ncbi:MAG: DUF1385 domain-containing protein [Bacillota bacterium]|nr:DUF1385 domain-containing protein [Bacillota bacterium]